MTIYDVIKLLPTVLTSNAPKEGTKTIQYKLSNPMYVVFDNSQCTVHEGLAPKFDVAFTIKDDLLLAMFKGQLNAPLAYMTGKLKIEGDKQLAQNVPSFFDLKKIL